MLTQGELAQFETFGFIVLRGMLKADEVHAMNGEFDIGLAAAEREMQRSGIRGQLNWSNLRPETPFLASLLEDDRFFGAAQQILGEDTIGSGSNANSFDGDSTEWHPDVRDHRWRGIKFGCYLQPLEEYSGALRLVPGSHKDPLNADLEKIVLTESFEGKDVEQGLGVAEVPAYIARSEPGDVVLFDNHTWHGSYGGSKGRRMCTVLYFGSPRTPEEETVVRAQAKASAGLVERWPLLARHPDWLANAEGSPSRKKWVEALRRWGFIEAPRRGSASQESQGAGRL